MVMVLKSGKYPVWMIEFKLGRNQSHQFPLVAFYGKECKSSHLNSKNTNFDDLQQKDKGSRKGFKKF